MDSSEVHHQAWQNKLAKDFNTTDAARECRRDDHGVLRRVSDPAPPG